MSALSWWEVAGCLLIAFGLAALVLVALLPLVPNGDRGEAEAVQDAPDPVDHAIDTAAEVARPDSRIAAKWGDQFFVDQVFAELVDAHRAQVHNHTDKEN